MTSLGRIRLLPVVWGPTYELWWLRLYGHFLGRYIVILSLQLHIVSTA
jgi:hypothetical protein